MMDDKIDPDDDNVVDPPLELPSLFYTNAAHQLAPIWCTRMYISGYVVLNGVGSCLIWRNQPICLVGISRHFLRDLYVLAKGTWFLLCTQKE
jgi:hypothetical protein